MLLAHNDFASCWRALLQHLVTAPLVDPRRKPTRERIGVTLHIEDSRRILLRNAVRQASYRFATAEWLWVWFGREDLATIQFYNPKMAEFSDNGVDFNGAYGPPIRAQWEGVRSRIERDPVTRQAVIVIFKPLRDEPTKDVPCTISMQFLRRHKLHCIVTMRSSDAWLGLPNDVFVFSQLQATMAAELKILPGALTLNLGSSHLYETDAVEASRALDEWDAPSASGRLPELDGAPPNWLEDLLCRRESTVDSRKSPWNRYVRALHSTSRALALGELLA